MDVNTFAIVGRLTRDAELKYSQEGNAVLRFAVAVAGYKKEDTSFFDVVAFGKTGEKIASYLTKGKQVGLSGHLSQHRWEQDGQSRSKVELIADQISLYGGGEKKAGEEVPF